MPQKMRRLYTIAIGARSQNIAPTPGAPSLPPPPYYWRIKFWDDGDLEGQWSMIYNISYEFPYHSRSGNVVDRCWPEPNIFSKNSEQD